MSNQRYRRSRSAGQVWIDHQSEKTVPTNTVMTPILKKKRSLNRLSERDLVDPKVSNYMVTHQEQDSDGDVETKIYKVQENGCKRRPLTPVGPDESFVQNLYNGSMLEVSERQARRPLTPVTPNESYLQDLYNDSMSEFASL